MKYMLTVVLVVLVGIPCGELGNKVAAYNYASELITPMVPSTLVEVSTGLETFDAPDTQFVICFSNGSGWIGYQRIKMFIGDELVELPEAVAGVVAEAKLRAEKKGDKIEIALRFAIAPATKVGAASRFLGGVLAKVTVASHGLVAKGKDEKLGVIPLHLPTVTSGKVGGPKKTGPSTVHAAVFGDRVELLKDEAKTTVADSKGKGGPDLGALADAVAGILPKNFHPPEYVIISSKKDVRWERVLQVAGVVRAAFAGSTELPGVVLAVVE